MRITGFDIDGFGIFNETKVKALPPGLVVFHGANEAGKSTCLAFVHAILFGFPDGRTKSQTQYPPLRGGSAGGRLFLSTESSVSSVSGDQKPEIVIERKPGVHGGPVTLMIGDEIEAEEGLKRLLQGVNLTLYRNLYGFSLTELQNLATLTDDEVKDVIYGASFGGGAQSFSHAVKTLTTKRTDLFKPKGRRSEINLFLKEIKAVRDDLNEARKDVSSFEHESERIRVFEAEIRDLRTLLESRRSSAKRSELHLKLWDDWLGLKMAREASSDLPQLEGTFPDDGLQRLGDLQTQLRAEEKNVRHVSQELEAAKAKLSQLVYDELIIAATGDIKALARGLETFENALLDIGRFEDREKTARTSVERNVLSFGPGWSEERALEIDRSAPTIDAIEKLQSDLEKTRGFEEKLKDRISQLIENRDERKIEVSRDEKKLEILGDRGPEVDRQLLDTLRERRELFTSVLRDIPNRKEDREDKRRDLKNLLKEIDPKWTREHLDGVDFSISTRERAVSSEERLVSARSRLEAARLECGHRIEELDEARISLEAVTRKRDDFGDVENIEHIEDHDLLRQKLRDLRRLVAKRELSIGEKDHVHERLGDLSRLLSMFKGLGLGLPVLGLFTFFMLEFQGQRQLGVVLLTILLGFAVVCFVLARRRGIDTAELAQRITEVESQIETLDTDIIGLKTQCEIEGELDSTLLYATEDRLDSDLRRGETLRRLTLQIEEAEAFLLRREKTAEKAENEVEKARTDVIEREKEWCNFITEFGLDERTTPRIFDRILARAAAAQQMIKEIDDFSDRIEKMEKIRREYLADARALPQLKDQDPEKLAAAVDRLHAELVTRDQRSTEIEIAENSREDSRKRYASAIELLGSTEVELEAAVASRNKAEQAWIRFLDDHGFDPSWSPATTRDMLNRLDQLCNGITIRDEAANERLRTAEVIEEFKTRAAHLFTLIDRPAPPLDQELASEIRKIVEIQESAVVVSSTAQATTEDINNRQLSLDAKQYEVRRLRDDLGALFLEGGAKDEADFRERAKLFEKRANIENEIVDRESRVRTISGETDLRALEIELEQENKADLQARCDQLKLEIDEADERLIEQTRASAEAGHERDRLASTDRIAALRAKEERLTEEIRERAYQWSRYAIATHLLNTAKARFEESHQPEVIQYATQFFSAITGGRYERVYAPHDKDHIDVVDAHGKRISAEVLSRGTQEQLYLAIRFGYIRAREKNAEPLPIIMDDVLVNFDPDRAQRAADAIIEMATTNQVLFFTCHPSAVEVFRAVDPNVVVFELEDGKIRQ